MSAKSVIRVHVPDWAKDAIWYQIFPERFCNGDSRNDPQIADFSSEPVPGWEVRPWGMDWYEQTAWEKNRGDYFHSVYLRRFGGDLVGVRKKLDYLQDLGVTALYLNPIFMAPSLHKYDGACFHHIDPCFGPDREGDLQLLARAGETENPGTWIWTAADRYFLELVGDVHRRGMRVIIDGVFNHTGTRFFAFQDLVKNGKKSRYKDWYRIEKWKKDGSFEYLGWFGHKGLPELERTQRCLVKPVKEYIFNITRRWMDPEGDGTANGVDGWRLDVAFCVPHGFWREWRRLVKGINPEAYITGEIVGPAGEFLRGDEFDGVMNYMWLYPTLAFFTPHEKSISAGQFRRAQDKLLKAYPKDAGYVLQNLLDSHDTGRVLTMLESACPPFDDWTAFFEFPRVASNKKLVTTKPGPRARQILRQMVVFQMTYVGAPMIYYGTEVGLWGANDPDNRQPMLWEDVEYSVQEHDFKGAVHRIVREPDQEIRTFFKRMSRLRNQHAVLRRGRLKWLDTTHPKLLAFARLDASSSWLILLNGSDETLDYPSGGCYRDVESGEKTAKNALIHVPARGWRLLMKI